MCESEVNIMLKKLFVNVDFEGLENLKKFSANRNLKVKSSCTDKTKVRIKILEA